MASLKLPARQDAEAILGAGVLLVAAFLLALVYVKDAHPSASQGGYTIISKFNRAEGLSVGSDVRVSGVVMGKVAATELGPDFRAVVTLRLKKEMELPVDTAAAIRSDSLLGNKFVELNVGGDEEMLKPGGEITYTADSLTFNALMELILNQARSKRGYVGKTLPKVF